MSSLQTHTQEGTVSLSFYLHLGLYDLLAMTMFLGTHTYIN